MAQEKDIQVASLGSLASEVSALYGLKSQPMLATARHEPSLTPDEQVKKSLDQFWMLKTSALNGGAAIGISMMGRRTSPPPTGSTCPKSPTCGRWKAG